MNSIDVLAQIGNAELVTSIFGQWPTFHDAEVLRFSLNRKGASGAEIVAAVHVFEMTSAVDQQGYYVLKDHTLVTMRFSGVSELKLSDFNEQNVLFELHISHEESGSLFHVNFENSYDLDANFHCKKVEVISAEPFAPPARPAQE